MIAMSVMANRLMGKETEKVQLASSVMTSFLFLPFSLLKPWKYVETDNGHNV